jgi:hypothetical protein
VSRLALVAMLEAFEAGDIAYAISILLSALEDEERCGEPSGCSTCGRCVIVITSAPEAGA